jgi:ADP-ribose pyrophosphatase YjhB (NUDIX family)
VEDGEGLTGCLRRELREELGVDATVGRYRGVVEHWWRREGTPQYELNHCFAVEAPALTADTAPNAREGYLSFGWVPLDTEALAEADLQPAPLRRLLVDGTADGTSWWASTVESGACG